MEGVGSKDGTRRRSPCALLFLIEKDVFDMTSIDRMVAAGMSRACAVETESWYMMQGDEDGLESYIVALEALSEVDQKHAV